MNLNNDSIFARRDFSLSLDENRAGVIGPTNANIDEITDDGATPTNSPTMWLIITSSGIIGGSLNINGDSIFGDGV